MAATSQFAAFVDHLEIVSPSDSGFIEDRPLKFTAGRLKWSHGGFLEMRTFVFVLCRVPASARDLPDPRLYSGPLHQPGRHSRPPGDPPCPAAAVRQSSFEAVLHVSNRCRQATVSYG